MLKYSFAKPTGGEAGQSYLDPPPDAEFFTYHHKHVGQALLGGLAFAAIIEAAALHLALSMWNHWIEVAVTVSSLWFRLQNLNQTEALCRR
ncbi:MAG: hypothetical protein MK106_03185 [Mariniblastus sp.]|nr:hypothetical protein [Mariniblastus sp.]